MCYIYIFIITKVHLNVDVNVSLGGRLTRLVDVPGTYFFFRLSAVSYFGCKRTPCILTMAIKQLWPRQVSCQEKLAKIMREARKPRPSCIWTPCGRCPPPPSLVTGRAAYGGCFTTPRKTSFRPCS